jgi:hypothetical protein
VLGAGAAMADRIPASATDEVGQGWWLGQHGEVGDSLDAHLRVVAHRETLSVVTQEMWGCSPASGWRGGGGRGSTGRGGGWCACGPRDGASWGGEWME